jgi:hypothetical protein
MSTTILQQGQQQQQSDGQQQQQQQQQGQQQQGQQGGGLSFHELINPDGTFAQGWTDKLPEAFKPFGPSVGRFPSITDLIGGYANAEKAISAKKLTPPGENATPEQVAEWRKLVGAPDKPDGYGPLKPEKLPAGAEWSDELAGKLAEIGHKHHLPKAALADLVALNLSAQEAAAQKNGTDAEAYVAQQTEALKKEWGQGYEENLAQSVKAAKLLGVDITDPEVGSNAKMIRLLHSASKLMREDKLLGGDGAQATLREQADQIRKGDDYQGKNGLEKQKAAQARIAALLGEKL